MAGRRAGLFQKYFAFIVLLVSGGLVASGAIGLYFSYQETRNSLVSLQREKALTASVRIEQFLDARPQFAIAAAGPVQMGGPRVGCEFQCREEHLARCRAGGDDLHGTPM